MRTNSNFGFEQIAAELMRGLIAAVADKPFPTPERKAAAQQTVVCTVMAYQPRDPIEMMMAGQCVVYDHLLLDGARDMLRGQMDEHKIRTRPGVLASGKMFLQTMAMLTRIQARPEAELAFARSVPDKAKQAKPAPDTERDAVRSADGGLAAQQTEPPLQSPPEPSDTSVPPGGAGTASASPPPLAVSDQAPSASVEANYEPYPDLSDPVAALAEMLSPGKIEALLMNGLTPEEREQFRDVFERNGVPAG
jgi:hypothetical protein